MKYIHPSRLTKGDTVGIVSPSSTIQSFPKRTSRGVENLEALGLSVVFASNAKKAFGSNGGTPEERAEDIHEMFSNPNIKAIVCSTGGFTTNAVLPLLDFKCIADNPKILCGYSDITALLSAVTAKAGLVTFHGPTLLPTFGEYGGVSDFTIRNWQKAVFSATPIGTLESTREHTQESLFWDKEDNRKNTLQPSEPMRVVRAGQARGLLLGGNLNTLCLLRNTEYFFDVQDAILFLEDEGESTSWVERHLAAMEQSGVFKKIKGLLYARPYKFRTDTPERTLENILQEYGNKYDIPIVCNVDCGHTNPMLTMPLGVETLLDADNCTVVIEEAAVL